LRIVVITWVDSHSFEGWVDKDDLDRDEVTIQSVGYLIKETTRALTITTSVSSADNYLSPLQIPLESILCAYSVNS
jgi:hypothetical protein